MESSPDVQNWRSPMRLKRPGIHRLEMLQAIAHGAEGTGYFQIRKGRGGGEKYHGAVIDHVGHERTRVFRAVADWGRDCERLAPVLGSRSPAQAALLYDWEARWGFELSSGPVSRPDVYDGVCQAHHRPFWARGVAVDVIGSDRDFSRYHVLITPQLYLLQPGIAERIARFVMTLWMKKSGRVRRMASYSFMPPRPGSMPQPCPAVSPPQRKRTERERRGGVRKLPSTGSLRVPDASSASK
jgi:beta-galactosidase